MMQPLHLPFAMPFKAVCSTLLRMQIYLTKDGKQEGPYSVNELNDLLESERITGDDLCWYEGSADWVPLSQFPGFAPPKPPALPPPPPTTAASQIPPAQPTGDIIRDAQSHPLGFAMLAVTALAAIFICFAGSEAATGIALATIWVTAILGGIEAKKLGIGKPGDLNSKGKQRRNGPWNWGAFMLLLWVIGFPAYLHRRSKYGARNLILPAIVVAVLFVAAPFFASPSLPAVDAPEVVALAQQAIEQSPAPKAGSAPAQPKPPSLAKRIFSNPEERAKKCAQMLVLENIKAPSTATFAETRIIYKQHPWYQVYVLVDAQNSFGAYIRNSFVCTLELGEGNKFSYMPAAGIQEMDENMIKLGGVLEGIRAASNWPGANKDESK